MIEAQRPDDELEPYEDEVEQYEDEDEDEGEPAVVEAVSVSDADRSAARRHVGECLSVVGEPVGNVFVIGSKADMDEFEGRGEECCSWCEPLHAAAVIVDVMSKHYDPSVNRFNFYAVNVLDRCDDPQEIAAVMIASMDRWIYIETAVGGSSVFRVHRKCLALFHGLRIVKAHNSDHKLSFAAFKD